MKYKQPTLWSGNFILITLGTIASCIGGVAMNIAMGIIVFDQTGSTALTGIYGLITTLPATILPILTAPYIDSHKRKNIIVCLDGLMAISYFIFAYITWKSSFYYFNYLMFGVVTSSIGSIYIQAYRALFPSLIPEGFTQKGYSVSSMVYPTVSILGAPFTAVFYTNFPIHFLFIFVGVLIAIACLMEFFIHVEERNLAPKTTKSLKKYMKEVGLGYEYLQSEKGIKYLYLNLAVTSSVSGGNNLMEMTYFQTSPVLSTTMYALLISAETLGRTVGGLLHYMIKIPSNRKYIFTRNTYIIYDILDGFLLFMPYVGMIVAKFICGFLGINSATMREAVLQQRLPNDKRARINATLGAIINGMNMLVLLIAGLLAEFLPYRLVAVIFTALSLIATYMMMVKKRKYVEPVFICITEQPLVAISY